MKATTCPVFYSKPLEGIATSRSGCKSVQVSSANGSAVDGSSVTSTPPRIQKRSHSVRNIAIVIIVVLLLLAVGIEATGSTSKSVPKSSVTSATLTVTCSGCTALTIFGNYQFSGAINNAGIDTRVQPPNATTSSYIWNLSRADTSSVWTISFNFQMNSQTGNMSVVVKLNTGQIAFAQSTTASDGEVSGSWSSPS